MRTSEEILNDIAELVAPLERKRGSTALPFWYVATSINGLVVMERGPFFSYEAADRYRVSHLHQYHPSTSVFVYCDSAHGTDGGLETLYKLIAEWRKPKDSTTAVREIEEQQ